MTPVQPAPGLAPGGRPASPGHGMFTLRETKPRLIVLTRRVRASNTNHLYTRVSTTRDEAV
jgi:hypothetical protein